MVFALVIQIYRGLVSRQLLLHFKELLHSPSSLSSSYAGSVPLSISSNAGHPLHFLCHLTAFIKCHLKSVSQSLQIRSVMSFGALGMGQ